MHNQSFQRSISLLTRPLSIAALVLLLLNDHILRIYFPSWITGKLGDFAWLYFFPFTLAALLSLVLPGKLGQRHTLVISLSISVISAVFILANTSPTAAAWLASQGGRLLGLDLRIHSDPTDLVALSSCALACWSWVDFKPASRFSYKQGWILLGLSAALTLANAALPGYGIICLWADPDRLVAGTNNYQRYESLDGGLSWSSTSERSGDHCDLDWGWSFVISVPENEMIMFMNKEHGSMEESRDGGESWLAIQEYQPGSQAEESWLKLTRNVTYQLGPYAAVSDPATGRLVFAMGLEGVLVRNPGGEWISVPVGEFQPAVLSPEDLPMLLAYEIYLAAAMALMVVITSGVFTGRSLWLKILLGLDWLIWLGTLVFIQPARMTYWHNLSGLSILVVGVLTLVTLIVWLVLSRNNLGSRLPWIAGAALLGFLAALLPFTLWALNWIPDYTWSVLLALFLGGLVLAVSWRNLTVEEAESTESDEQVV